MRVGASRIHSAYWLTVLQMANQMVQKSGNPHKYIAQVCPKLEKPPLISCPLTEEVETCDKALT